MPGPTTEAVNDDLKELRGDLHRVEVGLRGEVARVEVALTAEVGRVDKSLGRLAGEFAFFKWLLGGTFGVVVSGVVATVWGAGASAAKLDALNARVDRFEVSVDARLGRIEAAVARLAERAEAGKPPTPASK